MNAAATYVQTKTGADNIRLSCRGGAVYFSVHCLIYHGLVPIHLYHRPSAGLALVLLSPPTLSPSRKCAPELSCVLVLARVLFPFFRTLFLSVSLSHVVASLSLCLFVLHSFCHSWPLPQSVSLNHTITHALSISLSHMHKFSF